MSHLVPKRPTADAVARLVPFLRYAQGRRHLLPSDESARWFLRQHKQTLIESGALLMLGGRWMTDPERADVAVLEIGERKARELA